MVLVVEDEPALREVTKRIFTRNGYQVITAANGPEALDIARDHPGEIHLLVTDVVMPHMLGKEVAEKILEKGVLTENTGNLYKSRLSLAMNALNAAKKA